MNRIYKLSSLLICFLILLLVGCRKDDYSENTTTIDPPIVEEIESGISGIVSDENGDALEDATVTVRGSVKTTDANGYFNFNNLVLDGRGSLVKVQIGGHFTAYKQVFPTKQGKSFARFALIPRGEAQTFDSGSGMAVSIAGKAQVDFPADGMMYTDGQVFNGDVKVYSTYFDPTDEKTFITMPGNLGGQDKNGKQVQLGTYGMIGVELEDNSGRSLQLKSGVFATISLDIPSELVNNAPETIPLWHFDETLGIWKEEGSAVNQSGKYVGQVSHFSFWNCDIWWPSIKLSMKLVDPADNPISTFGIQVVADGLGSAPGYTNTTGDVSGLVPAGVDLSLVAYSCGERVIDQSIGTFTSDTDLGNVEIDYLKNTTTIQGRLLDCLDQPNGDAYGIIDYSGYFNKIIVPNADGSFSKVLTTCTNVDNSVVFYDAADLTTSQVESIDPNSPTNDLGDVVICDDLEEYLKFSIKGDNTNEALVTEFTVDLVDGKYLKVDSDWDVNGYARFNIDELQEGENMLSLAYFYHPNDGENYGGLICDEEFPCSQFSMEILTLGSAVGDYITGTFSGTLQPDSLIPPYPDPTLLDVLVEGQFKIKIDYAYVGASVSGTVWFDSDEDGVRTAADPFVQSNGRIFITNGMSGSEAVRKYVYLADDGTYTIDKLRPGEYTLSLQPSNGDFGINTTGVNIGTDDTIDNDFGGQMGNPTTHITLSEGEELLNVDAGLVQTENLTLSISHRGCGSETQLRINVLGNGAPPYVVKLNGTQELSTMESIIWIDVAGGQNYDIAVIDAFMVNAMKSYFVPENEVRIGVNVFEDKAPNVNGNWDSNNESFIDGVNIRMYDAGGALVKSITSTSNNTTDINDLVAGDYYFEADVPAGYTYTILPALSTKPNNIIDPSTGRSELIAIECNGYYQLHIGLVVE